MLPNLVRATLAIYLLMTVASLATAQWPSEISTGNIHCHANFALEPYQGLLTEVAALQQDLNRELGVSVAREQVHLYLFHEQSVYRSYLRKYFPDVPYRRALFVKSRGPGMVFAHLNDEFAVDVRHESTHALLHAALPMVPLWLDEGLAEYYEVARDERASSNPHLAQTKWNARLGLIGSIERLENLRDLSQMGRGEYRNAWALVHFMLHGPPAAREELTRFLADIEAHVPPGKLSRRLRQRIPNLDNAVTDHFLRWE